MLPAIDPLPGTGIATKAIIPSAPYRLNLFVCCVRVLWKTFVPNLLMNSNFPIRYFETGPRIARYIDAGMIVPSRVIMKICKLGIPAFSAYGTASFTSRNGTNDSMNVFSSGIMFGFITL